MQEIWKTLTTNKDDGWQRYNWTKKRMHCSIQVVKPISKCFTYLILKNIYRSMTMAYRNGPNELSIWCCLFQDRILCTKVNMSVHPDEIIFCEKSSTKQIFYPRQKIKLDRLAISTKRDVKYFKKESHFE